MQEWVDNPRAETALSNILPCVDERTTNQTLYESRNVVSKVVETVNTYIYTAANTDRPPSDQFYYNQSGPLVPPLCFPFDDKMHDRNCSSQEVSMTNASMVCMFKSMSFISYCSFSRLFHLFLFYFSVASNCLLHPSELSSSMIVWRRFDLQFAPNIEGCW